MRLSFVTGGIGFTDPILVSMKELGDSFAEPIKQQLKTAFQPGMESVLLEWDYEGKTLYSTALVCNEHGGVLFDPIGTYLIGERKTISEEDGLPTHCR